MSNSGAILAPNPDSLIPHRESAYALKLAPTMPKVHILVINVKDGS
jgi:hypothetical protein